MLISEVVTARSILGAGVSAYDAVLSDFWDVGNTLFGSICALKVVVPVWFNTYVKLTTTVDRANTSMVVWPTSVPVPAGPAQRSTGTPCASARPRLRTLREIASEVGRRFGCAGL